VIAGESGKLLRICGLPAVPGCGPIGLGCEDHPFLRVTTRGQTGEPVHRVTEASCMTYRERLRDEACQRIETAAPSKGNA